MGRTWLSSNEFSDLKHSLSLPIVVGECDNDAVRCATQQFDLARRRVRHRGTRNALCRRSRNRWHMNCFGVSEDSRQRPTIMNAFSPELAEHWRASQASNADDRRREAARRFAVAGPTGSLGGTRRARQRRAQRLLIRTQPHTHSSRRNDSTGPRARRTNRPTPGPPCPLSSSRRAFFWTIDPREASIAVAADERVRSPSAQRARSARAHVRPSGARRRP